MTRHDLGDGPLCPESPMHGKTYIIPTPDGRELCWCPVDQGRYSLVNGHDAGERVRTLATGPSVRYVARSGASRLQTGGI